jgi:hypothetical protein
VLLPERSEPPQPCTTAPLQVTPSHHWSWDLEHHFLFFTPLSMGHNKKPTTNCTQLSRYQVLPILLCCILFSPSYLPQACHHTTFRGLSLMWTGTAHLFIFLVCSMLSVKKHVCSRQWAPKNICWMNELPC